MLIRRDVLQRFEEWDNEWRCGIVRGPSPLRAVIRVDVGYVMDLEVHLVVDED